MGISQLPVEDGLHSAYFTNKREIHHGGVILESGVEEVAVKGAET